jgi:hypothetical protein
MSIRVAVQILDAKDWGFGYMGWKRITAVRWKRITAIR